MPYDIFISYAHHDNRIHRQWVEKFRSQLADRYFANTGEELSIFLDREGINPGDSLKPSLKKALLDSAIFVPILSPPYLSSRNCCEEFIFFKNEAGDKLWLEGSSCRIVPLRLTPYEKAKDTDLTKEVREFLSQNDLIYLNFFADPRPMPPKGERFEDAVAKLSRKIEQLLEKLRKPQPIPSGRAIYLALTTTNSRTLREKLLKEFQQQRKHGKIDSDWSILPDEAVDIPPNLQDYSAAAFTEFIQPHLSRATFSIHLFDDLEGIKTVDTREPIVQLQYKLAKAEAECRTDITLLTASVKTEECSDQQEAFIQSISADALTMAQVEALSSAEFIYIRDHLLDKIKMLKEETASASNAKTDDTQRIFFVHDERDTDDHLRKRIKGVIDKYQYEVLASSFETKEIYDGGYSEKLFKDTWAMCNRALILLLNGNPRWCNAIRVKLMQYAKEERLHEIAVCVGDPDAPNRIEYVKSNKLFVIDCTKPSLEQDIATFLKPTRHV